jgi:hypothetical protein
LGLNEGVGVVLEFLFELVVLFLPESHLVFEFFVLGGDFLSFIFSLAMELFGGLDFGVFLFLIGVEFSVVDFKFVGFIGEAFDFEGFAFDLCLEFEFLVGGLLEFLGEFVDFEVFEADLGLEMGVFFDLIVEMGFSFLELLLEFKVELLGGSELNFDGLDFEFLLLKTELFLLIFVFPLHHFFLQSLYCLVETSAIQLVLLPQLVKLPFVVPNAHPQFLYLCLRQTLSCCLFLHQLCQTLLHRQNLRLQLLNPFVPHSHFFLQSLRTPTALLNC